MADHLKTLTGAAGESDAAAARLAPSIAALGDELSRMGKAEAADMLKEVADATRAMVEEDQKAQQSLLDKKLNQHSARLERRLQMT